MWSELSSACFLQEVQIWLFLCDLFFARFVRFANWDKFSWHFILHFFFTGNGELIGPIVPFNFNVFDFCSHGCFVCFRLLSRYFAKASFYIVYLADLELEISSEVLLIFNKSMSFSYGSFDLLTSRPSSFLGLWHNRRNLRFLEKANLKHL